MHRRGIYSQLRKPFRDNARFYTQVGSAFYVAPEVFINGGEGYDGR